MAVTLVLGGFYAWLCISCSLLTGAQAFCWLLGIVLVEMVNN